jgi:hypothetical protein
MAVNRAPAAVPRYLHYFAPLRITHLEVNLLLYLPARWWNQVLGLDREFQVIGACPAAGEKKSTLFQVALE